MQHMQFISSGLMAMRRAEGFLLPVFGLLGSIMMVNFSIWKS